MYNSGKKTRRCQKLKVGLDAVDGLIAYMGPHAKHTDYPRRLKEGRSIGSGMVEGSCKTVVGCD